MERKKFLKNGLLGLSAIVALPMAVTSCKKNEDDPANPGSCAVSPSETIGPFLIQTPAQLVRASIIGNRAGVALLMNLTIQDRSNGCTPLEGVFVDVWQCDRDGDYSQYGGSPLQQTDYRNETFLRGRQTTNANGQVSFISIFPGWYPGRAPHIHVQILSSSGSSLLVTQIAFPVDVYTAVYASAGYHGAPDTSNTRDYIFADSLNANMADAVTGNITDGYTLLKTITVA